MLKWAMAWEERHLLISRARSPLSTARECVKCRDHLSMIRSLEIGSTFRMIAYISDRWECGKFRDFFAKIRSSLAYIVMILSRERSLLKRWTTHWWARANSAETGKDHFLPSFTFVLILLMMRTIVLLTLIVLIVICCASSNGRFKIC